MTEERFDQIDRRLDAHDVQLATLVVGQSSLLNAVAELQAGQLLMKAELTRHMHVLHEDLVDRIKATGPTRRRSGRKKAS